MIFQVGIYMELTGKKLKSRVKHRGNQMKSKKIERKIKIYDEFLFYIFLYL